MRCPRTTIGMKVDHSGLSVRIPSRESVRWVESVLQTKADWIVKKLNSWHHRKPCGPKWEEGAIFPLLGEPWQVTITANGAVRMRRTNADSALETQLKLPLPSRLTAQQIECVVMEWYCDRAMSCFRERMALYSQKLGIALPQLKLSRARTLWGSCHARGVVRLNWRLIQKPLDLVDYVVAHELAHLIEMNHSMAFWQTVERVYPNCKEARKKLRGSG
ncbi:MAG: M48 family metallopeptidase [Nitrosospira sp.]|nr:M48 family metallopeptidase [Nitrosospira sp.]